MEEEVRQAAVKAFGNQRYRQKWAEKFWHGNGGMPVALAAILGFLVAAFSVCNATVDEGSVLLGLMKSWGVGFETWVPAQDPCMGQWEGVTCAQGHVSGINLSNHGLSGGIPAAIGQLTYLTCLDVSNNIANSTTVGPWNTLTGNLPDELSNLKSLEILNLNYLPLSIQFPQVVLELANLVTLNIGNANMTGMIPPGLGQLSKLQILWLSNNSFTGVIPSAIGNLKDLISLSLSYISFDSALPDELGNLSELTYMNIHDCNLWGGLPASFGQLRKLQRLLLYSNQLTGFIPEQWQDMTSLQQLYLQKNYLSGSVPGWLLQQQNLTQLRLEQNQFQGPFPSLDGTKNFTSLNLQCNYFTGPYPNTSLSIVDGNCFTNVTANNADDSGRVCQRNLGCAAFLRNYPLGTCAPCPPSSSVLVANAYCTCSPFATPPVRIAPTSKFEMGPVLGAALGVALVLGIVIGYAIWRTKAVKQPVDVFSTKPTQGSSDHEMDRWEVPEGVHRYNFQELSKATQKFDEKNEIGAGGFGKVFAGTLADGKMVAIKRASTTSLQGLTEFHNEIALLSRLHHRNLVRLEGFCDDFGFRILVYEYMKNGNLSTLLYGNRLQMPLHWYKRLEIAVGVAQGLEYLHSYADPPVIHRDVKPSNILLDENFSAKLSDFGISKVNPDLETHLSTRPAGTAGYLDPQYFVQRQLTTASDVYGFGMVLLELVSGQRIIDYERQDGYNLGEWVKPRFRNGGIEAIVDPALVGYSKEVLSAMADVAIQCTNFERQERPSMKVVLSILEAHIQNSSSHPPTPVSSCSLATSESFTDILRFTGPVDSFSSSTGRESVGQTTN